ncbi:hypothetical protein ACHAXR_005467, partial [Thalassiosira sp. AJA248-18]
MTTSSSNNHRSTRLITCLCIATISDLSHSFAPSNRSPLRTRKSHAAKAAKDNIEDYINSLKGESVESANKEGQENSSTDNPKPPQSNQRRPTNKEGFQETSTDDFRRPHGSVGTNVFEPQMTPRSFFEKGGDEQTSTGDSNKRQQDSAPQNKQRQPTPLHDNTYRHAFQMSSTDDFKRPHGMPAGMDQPRPPPRGDVNKSPFQTSTTDDFKRSSDEASGVGAPQQAAFKKPSQSDTPPSWFGSNQPPQPAPQQSQQPAQSVSGSNVFEPQKTPRSFFDAQIIDDQRSNSEPPPPMTNHQPAQATPPMTNHQPDQATPPMTSAQISTEQHLETWDQKLETAQSKSRSTMIRNIQWPLMRDPPGVSSEFPLLMTRVVVTILATVSTRYLHLYNGFSPVLASSATTLLVSTCLDRRLGQAAFCGSFAGMSGGHLAPDISMTMVLGALTSVCYELLIHINNLCLGIGGRLGATAFLATSIMAKYRGVGVVGRKMRRGLWKAGAGPSSIVVSMILYHVLGSVATIFLREYSDDSAAADPVRASSVVGLLGSLYMKDPTALFALYGGSFVGMALPSRLMY